MYFQNRQFSLASFFILVISLYEYNSQTFADKRRLRKLPFFKGLIVLPYASIFLRAVGVWCEEAVTIRAIQLLMHYDGIQFLKKFQWKVSPVSVGFGNILIMD